MQIINVTSLDRKFGVAQWRDLRFTFAAFTLTL
jgi:hypothetical protein